MIRVDHLYKSFTLQNQVGAVISVMADANLQVPAVECVGLIGPSGVGKSTIMRMVYGNYLCQSGRILVGGLDVTAAEPREILTLRRHVLGYVSQFLRVVPRVLALEVVAEPLLQVGTARPEALARAAILLARLNLPDGCGQSARQHSLVANNSGSIMRGFAYEYPALLLDEQTASIDETNRNVVIRLILDAKARGVAIIGILHDEAVRQTVCDRCVDVTNFLAVAA